MTLRLRDLRRFIVARQGFATRRRVASARDVEDAIRRLSCVQLDSIATVERSHKLVLASRVGRLPRDAEWGLVRKGRVFEYWAHEASLVPIEDHPLFLRRMRDRREHHWWGPVLDADPALARRVLRMVREKGPLRSDDFEGRNTGMWGLKPEKRMLDALWTAGKLAIAGRDGFVRRYDLPERVLPAAALRARMPSRTATLRGLAVRAVEARGALTLPGILGHYRIEATQKELQPHLDALVREGALVREEVDDGGSDVYLPAEVDVSAAPAPHACVLLSPFDNLLWDRAFARRVFGFDHVMEIYKPQPTRRFGYYVMPLLDGDRIVGRADVKADREAGLLRVRAAHWEREPRRDALERALGRLAWTLGLRTA